MEYTELTEIEERMADATNEERMAEVLKYFPKFKLKTSYIRESDKGANMYQVTLQNGRDKFTTTFTDSLYNTCKGVRSSDISILYCILMDAQTYEFYNSVEDFADNTGIDIYTEKEYKKAERIYNACERLYTKVVRIFGGEGYQILNAITSQM